MLLFTFSLHSSTPHIHSLFLQNVEVMLLGLWFAPKRINNLLISFLFLDPLNPRMTSKWKALLATDFIDRVSKGQSSNMFNWTRKFEDIGLCHNTTHAAFSRNILGISPCRLTDLDLPIRTHLLSLYILLYTEFGVLKSTWSGRMNLVVGVLTSH